MPASMPAASSLLPPASVVPLLQLRQQMIHTISGR
jgi:hypothetical protein